MLETSQCCSFHLEVTRWMGGLSNMTVDDVKLTPFKQKYQNPNTPIKPEFQNPKYPHIWTDRSFIFGYSF